MNTPIIDMLERHVNKDAVSFHMPGHKGRSGFLPERLLPYDITELAGADNLMIPKGVIKESQKNAASAFFARECHYIVNGSSLGVEAMIMAAVRPGEKLLIARDMHVSALNGIAFSGAVPIFVYPRGNSEITPVITTADVKRAISENPDAKALYLTYPNYYGLCCDLEQIAHITHSVGIKLIVDGAHSAAFAFSGLLPCSCGEAGADAWTVSLHKTLGCPNQCACLCVGDSDIQVKRYINMLQTTSPSYLLLASMEYAAAQMSTEGEALMAGAVSLVENFILKAGALGGFKCMTANLPAGSGAYDRDIMKVVIDVAERGVSGFRAAQKLASEGVFVECADARSIMLLCTCFNTKQDYIRLLEALDGVYGPNYAMKPSTADAREYVDSEPSYADMSAVMTGGVERTSFVESVGKRAACGVGAYPPGVPIILPGETVTVELLERLTRLANAGYELFGTDGGYIDTVYYDDGE